MLSYDLPKYLATSSCSTYTTNWETHKNQQNPDFGLATSAKRPKCLGNPPPVGKECYTKVCWPTISWVKMKWRERATLSCKNPIFEGIWTSIAPGNLSSTYSAWDATSFYYEFPSQPVEWISMEIHHDLLYPRHKPHGTSHPSNGRSQLALEQWMVGHQGKGIFQSLWFFFGSHTINGKLPLRGPN